MCFSDKEEYNKYLLVKQDCCIKKIGDTTLTTKQYRRINATKSQKKTADAIKVEKLKPRGAKLKQL